MTVTAKRRRPWDNAMQCIVEDLRRFTGREAHRHLGHRWPRIWAIGAPLGMTKLQASRAAWNNYKASRRQFRENE